MLWIRLAAARNYTPWMDGIFSNMGDYHRLAMAAHRAKNIGNTSDDSVTHPVCSAGLCTASVWGYSVRSVLN